MKKQNEMTSFERMKAAACEMVKEDLGVEAVSCKSHTSKTLKVVAHPDKPNTVDLFVPYQVFVGAKTNAVCADWDVDYWKMAFRQLGFEFGVKNCPRTRLMTRRVKGANPRMYADFFWKRIEGMENWNIVLPEIHTYIPNNIPEAVAEIKETACEDDAVKARINIEEAYEQMGLKFTCM